MNVSTETAYNYKAKQIIYLWFILKSTDLFDLNTSTDLRGEVVILVGFGCEEWTVESWVGGSTEDGEAVNMEMKKMKKNRMAGGVTSRLVEIRRHRRRGTLLMVSVW